jgi:hypothetical protein
VILWMVPKVRKLVPCWEDYDFVVEVGVGYLALFLVKLVGCLLWDMLFAGVSKGM